MKATHDSVSGSLVHIVGRNKLQNELLASFLEKEAGLKCMCSPTLDPPAGIDKEPVRTSLVWRLVLRPGQISYEVDKEPVRISLVLLDCLSTDMANLWTGLAVESDSNQPQCFTALFNVNPDMKIEREAVDQGVRGIFYDNEPPERISKGVLAVLNGELWYSRETLTKRVWESRGAAKLTGGAADDLTLREKEILMMVASGARYKDIANELCISPNTVKTHIYNIYKKIDVPNRLQAMVWSAKHL